MLINTPPIRVLQEAPMVPAAVSASTCAFVLSLPWTTALKTCERLKLPVLRVGRKKLIPVAPFLEALAKAQPESVAPDVPEFDTTPEALARRIGLRLVGGA